MALLKIYRATRVESVCTGCGGTVKIGEKYYLTDEKLNPPMPWPKAKYCIKCGDERGGLDEHKAN